VLSPKGFEVSSKFWQNNIHNTMLRNTAAWKGAPHRRVGMDKCLSGVGTSGSGVKQENQVAFPPMISEDSGI
jgi:hypothetical protein